MGDGINLRFDELVTVTSAIDYTDTPTINGVPVPEWASLAHVDIKTQTVAFRSAGGEFWYTAAMTRTPYSPTP